MNAVRKYNAMIEIIEQCIEKRMSVDEILEQLMCSGLCDKRVFAEIFKFMTGMSAVEYIKERQLMRAYRVLIEDKGEINKAIEFTDLTTHSSFDKKFKLRFGLTPKEAKTVLNKQLYQEPLTWIALSDKEYRKEDEMMYDVNKQCLKFGIEQGRLSKYNEAMEMQALYGFSEEETEIAFDFAERNNIQMKKAFEYIDAGFESIDIDEDGFGIMKTQLSKDEIERVIKYAEILRYICENSDLPIKKADYLTYLMNNHIKDIKSISIETIMLFNEYKDKFFDYGEFYKIHSFFISAGGEMDWWDEYVCYISEGLDYIEAFDIIENEKEEWDYRMENEFHEHEGIDTMDY